MVNNKYSLGQNCTKTKLHEGSISHKDTFAEGEKLHKDNFAWKVNFAQVQKKR